MSHQIITTLSTKGGVGKTTLTANLGGFLSSAGYRVLMVDADFQPALSSYFKITKQAPFGLTALYGGACNLSDCISKTEFGDLIVSDDPAGLLQNQAMSLADGRLRLKQQLDKLRDSYDFILIDTQGAAGAMQEAAALAADIVVSPLPMAALAVQEFERGTMALVRSLKGFEGWGLKIPEVKGVMWLMENTRDCAEITDFVRNEFDGRTCEFLKAGIFKRVAWGESATHQRPVNRLGSRAEKAISELSSFVVELLPQVEVQL